MLEDLARVVRGYMRTWQTTLAVLSMVALGAAASSAAIALIDTVLINPLQVSWPDRLVVLRGAYPSIAGDLSSAADFLDYRTFLRGFQHLAAYSDHEGSVSVMEGGRAFRARGAETTTTFFTTMGLALRYGRGFLPEEQSPGRNRVIVIGDTLWSRVFDSSPDVVGRRVTLNGIEFTVVGVAPPGFRFPRTSEFWIPVSLGSDRVFTGQAISYTVFGRLAPDCSMGQARSNVELLASTVRREFPSSWITRRPIDLVPMSEIVSRNARSSVQILALALGLVWVCAIMNISTIVVTRSAARTHELAVRWSLGASPRQLLGYVAADGILVFITGVGFGLASAWASTVLFIRSLPVEYGGGGAPLPGFVEILLVLALSGFSGIACVLPNLRRILSGVALNFSTLSRAQSNIGRVGTLARVLIAPQVAVALVLMMGTVSFTVSLIELQRVDVGFNPMNAVALSVPAIRQPPSGPPGRQVIFDEVLDRAGRVPGVNAAGATSALPLGDSDVIGLLFRVLGQPSPKEFKNRFAITTTVTPGYFRAIGMKLLAGRSFNRHDTAESAPVAVVNRTLAEQYGGEQRILGQRVALPARTAPVEVVGVVADVRQLGLDTEPGQQIFLPHTQDSALLQTFVFRCDDRLDQITSDVRAIIAKDDPSLPIYNVVTLEHLVDAATARPRLLSRVIGIFALLACILAGVGIYASLSQFIVERRRDIGLRIALGARTAQVARLVVGRTLLSVAVGITVGTLSSVVVVRLAASVVPGLQLSTLPGYVAAAMAVMVIAVAASVAPALNAAKVDPGSVLRDE